MGQPAAKQGDQITATDTHLVITPGGGTPAATPFPFNGVLQNSLSTNVNIMGQPAATVVSIAMNVPQHIPVSGSFKSPPSNQGRIIQGSGTVMINGQPAARNGDTAMTCNDPTDMPVGTVVASGTVLIG